MNNSTPISTRRLRTHIVVAIALLLVGGTIWRSHRRAPESATADAADAAPAEATAAIVETATARLAPMETIVAAQGILTPAQGASARVAVLSTGRLTHVLVREGERVVAGQLLAQVDNRSAIAGEAGAAAALSAALSDARQADMSTSATQNEQSNALRQARLALNSARADRNGAVGQAIIALSTAESDLRKARVSARAPDVAGALKQAKLAAVAARQESEASVKAANNALQAAQTDLEKLRAGARPQEISQTEQVVTQAQATRDRAATEVERVQYLFDKGIKARRELDDAKTASKVAEAGLVGAQNALSLLRSGARTEDKRAAQLRVEGAKQALDAAQQSASAREAQAQAALQLAGDTAKVASRQRPEDVRAATLKVAAAGNALRQTRKAGDSRVLQAEAALTFASRGTTQIAIKTEDARAKAALAKAKQADLSVAEIATRSGDLRAPLGGIVTKRYLNDGDLADPATPVVEIADAQTLNLLANLPAENGLTVHIGQNVRVRAESAPSLTFAGQVLSTGQVDPQSGLLTVRIAVDNPHNALKIGALASCDIIVARRPKAVVVPSQAIIMRNGKPTVFVVRNGQAQSRRVTPGTESGGFTEICSGINAGEELIQLGQFELEDGAAVKSATAAP